MRTSNNPQFNRYYELHCINYHLRLKGLQPKTIEAYSRAMRSIRDYFGHGRNAGYPAPPVQIRTCATNAYGSYLECLAQS